MNRHLRLVGGIALAVLASSLETFNHSFQTITTVGYGNWVPAGWDIKEMDLQNRILYVKAISLPFMLVGGALFAVLIGILSNLLSRAAR